MIRHVSLSVFLLCVPLVLHAQVSITEIMYDLDGSDTGREWVEVHNTGSAALDLSLWKFFEGNTNHGLVHSDGPALVEPGHYAVIVDKPEKFLLDHPGTGVTILDSSFSLNNTGEVLIIRNSESLDIDSVTYSSEQGAAGDGNSLSFVGSVWRASIPTPGADNSSEQVISGSNSEQDESESGEQIDGNEPPQSSPVISRKQIVAEVVAPQAVLAGAKDVYSGEGYGFKGEPLKHARFLWNFGDGTLQEGKSLYHTYYYPGEYVASLTVSSGEYSATDSVVVNVVEPLITVTLADDNRIVLENGAAHQVDISGWSIQNDKDRFVFPVGTVLLGGREVTFARKVTGLRVLENDVLALKYPNGDIYTTYIRTDAAREQLTDTDEVVTPATESIGMTAPRPSNQVATAVQTPSSIKPTTLTTEELTLTEDDDMSLDISDTETQEERTQLAAAATASRGDTEDYLWYMGLLFVIAIGTWATVLHRKDRTEADEYEIIDETEE